MFEIKNRVLKITGDTIKIGDSEYTFLPYRLGFQVYLNYDAVGAHYMKRLGYVFMGNKGKYVFIQRFNIHTIESENFKNKLTELQQTI